jgi:hypothetical protein
LRPVTEAAPLGPREAFGSPGSGGVAAEVADAVTAGPP